MSTVSLRKLTAAFLAAMLAMCVGGVVFAQKAFASDLSAGQTSVLATQMSNEIDLTKSINKTYSFTSNGGYIYWKMTKPGIASVKITVDGVSKIDYSLWYARGSEIKSTDLGVAAEDYPTKDGIGMTVSCSGSAEGQIVILKSSADKGSDKKVTLHITSTFQKANATAKTLKSGSKVNVIQAAGDVYWPIKLKKASRVTLDVKEPSSTPCTDDDNSSGISLCNAKKKALRFYLGAKDRCTYMLPKGTYYVRSRITKKFKADKVSFSISAKSVGNYADAKNTTRAKAKRISLGKKSSGLIGTTNPAFKAHYYKLSLKKTTKFSVTWKNSKGVKTDLSILNNKGKELYGSVSDNTSGKNYFYYYKDKQWKDISKTVTLKKGTYYFKVTKVGGDYGAYAFTVK